jgi:hypothetical protein
MSRIKDPLTFEFESRENNRFELDGAFHTLIEALTISGHPLNPGNYDAEFVEMSHKNITAKIRNGNGNGNDLVIIGVQ